MRLICNTRGIAERFRPRGGLRNIRLAGFENALYSASIFCDPSEFRDIKKMNFKRDYEVYLTEHPESLPDVMGRGMLPAAKELGLSLPVAAGPYVSSEVRSGEADPEVLRALSEETLKAAIGAGCESVILYPVAASDQAEDPWPFHKALYTDLARTADTMESGIRILLVNSGKNVNGHIIRGICSEAEEMTAWVDKLNALAGKERFGCCFDIGTATMCGQNLYEAVVPLGERLKAVILRDSDGVHEASMLPYTACAKGQQTDWLSLIRALRKLDFDGDLIMDFTETYRGYTTPLWPAVLKMAYETGEYFDWQIGMERMIRRYDKRVLFGAGNMCRAYMKDYGEKYPPLFTCDNSSARWGEEFCGLKIESPEKLKELSEDTAIFICNVYYDEISEQLKTMGLKNPVERFNDEYMATFHTDRIRRASEPVAGKGAKA